MKNKFVGACALGVLLLASGNVYSDDKDKDDRFERFSTRLSSFNEVHFNAGNATTPPSLRGAISSAAKGSFKATLDKVANVIHYELNYQGLESDITQSHIHFGQRHTVGGIVVWLCKTASNQPSDAAVSNLTPTCPTTDPRNGTVGGTIIPAQVITVTGQGINTGEFDELIRALRAGAIYANVHTTTFTPGEIRGQVRRNEHRD